MSDLKQVELDLFEQKCLMKLSEIIPGVQINPQTNALEINPLLRLGAKQQFGIENIEDKLQQTINTFEEIMKPMMYDNGIVCGEKLGGTLKTMFPKFFDYIDLIPKRDFRLVDIISEFNLQQIIQKMIGV